MVRGPGIGEWQSGQIPFYPQCTDSKECVPCCPALPVSFRSITVVVRRSVLPGGSEGERRSASNCRPVRKLIGRSLSGLGNNSGSELLVHRPGCPLLELEGAQEPGMA
ncbi:unnamed protein product [Pleuronectes platessa]|uniref:Uncharacterized protein n=1 Tax=Pleuronectes platessa TaxID=8262 RepID=A0A9N7VQW3_PLEPL|nr:unnamed protein product [Pleuronectes platessa]